MTVPQNTVAQPLPYPGSIEEWAEHDPERIAQVEGDLAMSYGEIDRLADRLSTSLSDAGLKSGDIVAVRTQIRSEWAVIDTALAKLGCANLGINWRLTAAEVQFILSDSGARFLIVDDPDPRPMLDAVSQTDVLGVASIDVFQDGCLSYDDLLAVVPRRLVAPKPVRRLVYTSGTTGSPKGVLRSPAVTPEALEYTQSVRSTGNLGPDDVALQVLPYSQGSGPRMASNALTAGAKLVLLRRFDPREALELVRRHGVTHWTTVPTMLKRVAVLPPDELERLQPTTLCFMETGGAPVPPEVLAWASRYFGPVISEGYGATEVGLVAYATPAERAQRPGTCGRPYRHVVVDIRNEEGTSLPSGSIGEIWVKTPLMIDNYLNAPPMGPETLDANGLFRTGDVGKLDQDGYLYITDRAKEMIVSGGMNIYPAEVEAALITHPEIQDAAVIGIPDDEFGEQVRAYLEPKPGGRVDPDDVRQLLVPLLASYKRPKSYEVVDELPRNLMGKIMKKELREPFWRGRERRI